MKKLFINHDVHFKSLHLVNERPYLNQRELAQELVISLGSLNNCIKALIDIGHIEAKNFSQDPKKLAYLYLLTPKGISEKTRLTSSFLKRKMGEYHTLKKEIATLKLSLKD